MPTSEVAMLWIGFVWGCSHYSCPTVTSDKPTTSFQNIKPHRSNGHADAVFQRQEEYCKTSIRIDIGKSWSFKRWQSCTVPPVHVILTRMCIVKTVAKRNNSAQHTAEGRFRCSGVCDRSWTGQRSKHGYGTPKLVNNKVFNYNVLNII